MKTTFIAKEGNDAKFTMVFTGEEFENAVVNAYKNNKDRFEIKGFRKGKAPRKMIENTYGEDIFYDEALNDLLQSGYPAALNELELEVIDQPKLNLGELKKGEDVEITATVACFPEVEAKDYFGLEVEKIEHEVTDEDIQKLADTFLAFQNGTLEDVKGFCTVSTTQDIAKQDYILTPGRYVGIEEQKDDGEPFEEKMDRLTSELC